MLLTKEINQHIIEIYQQESEVRSQTLANIEKERIKRKITQQITFSMDWESSFIKSSFERSETFSKEKVLATSRTQSSTCNIGNLLSIKM